MLPEVLVVGDVMLDVLTQGAGFRLSPEAPVPVVHSTAVRHSLGGAGNLAANILAMGHPVALAGFIGRDDAGEKVRELAAGMTASLHVWCAPTTVKHRVMAGTHQLLRMDQERVTYQESASVLSSLAAMPEEMLSSIKIVVLADYMKGVLSADVVNWIKQAAANRGWKIYADAKPATVGYYTGVHVLRMNQSEAMAALSSQPHPGLVMGTDEERTATACLLLQQATGAGRVIITAGSCGCFYTDETQIGGVGHEPTANVATQTLVADVCGAGDTVTAALVSADLEGMSLAASARFAMYCARNVVQRVGVVAADRDVVDDLLHRQGWQSKIMTPPVLDQFLARRRRLNPKGSVVLTNGCFDVLHSAHIELFEWAKQQGDTLVVAYNSDDSLRACKGEDRPHIPEPLRAKHIALQQSVDAVVSFDGDMGAVVRRYQPDILIKGRDARSKPIPGEDYMAARGGRVMVPDFYLAVRISRDHMQHILPEGN